MPLKRTAISPAKDGSLELKLTENQVALVLTIETDGSYNLSAALYHCDGITNQTMARRITGLRNFLDAVSLRINSPIWVKDLLDWYKSQPREERAEGAETPATSENLH